MTQGSWLIDREAALRLERLDPLLVEAASPSEVPLSEMATWLLLLRGKRLRPALLFLAASFGKAQDSPLLRAAAALELVHVASLHHDDVMDRAPTRRGAASVNQRWGNVLAVMAGTYLFARATKLLAGLGDEVNLMVSRACADLCAGQLHEVENAFNLDLSETEHLEILGRKTATLFELPCRLGALLADVSDQATRSLSAYGRCIGLAFQLVDDSLDVAGRPGELGKRTGTDLRQGVYSLPVLLAARSEGSSGERIRGLLSQVRPSAADLTEVLDLVRASHAVGEVSHRAERLVNEAVASLEPLPDGPARQSLEQLASFVVSRSS